jgi:hypothetical protein
LLGPDHREGATMLLVFLLRKVLFWFSEAAKYHRMQQPSIPPIPREESRRSPIPPIDSAIEPKKEY